MEISTISLDGGKLVVNSEYAELLRCNGINAADKLWSLHGTTVKKVLKERGTERLMLTSIDYSGMIETFIKRFTFPPLKEKLKAALSMKFKTFNALDEWNAIVSFHKHELPTMTPLAAARIGSKTCVLTLGINEYVRASELFENFTEADLARKRALIEKIARLAGGMHAVNMAHQDFYLVHMFVREEEDDKVYLIDLQRVMIQRKLSVRWRVKDLAQLYFSARPFVSQTDILRFWKIYTGMCGVELYEDSKLIVKIFRKAEKIRLHTEKKYRKK